MRHKRVRLTLAILEAFVALTAIGCGLGLEVGAIQFPLVWLAGTPFSDYALPGLLMAVIVGGSSLLATATIFTEGEAGVLVSILAGLLLLGFEFVEATSIDPNLGYGMLLALVFQMAYSAIALVIVGLAVSLWMREYRRHHFPTGHLRHA